MEASSTVASRCFMFMYFLLPHWVPATWRSRAQTSIFLSGITPHIGMVLLKQSKTDLKKEIAILQKYGIKSCGMPSRRIDTHGRDLRFRIASPAALDVPFLMTYFSVDPKPVDFVHPNGITEISKVVYGTDPARFTLIKELCDDERLELEAGNGIEVEFENKMG